jgi:hypothetical protein
MLMTLKRTDFRSFRFCGLFLFLLLPFGIFTVTRLGPFIYMSPSPDGHYFLIALGYRTVDLSKVVTGGQKSVLLTDNHALAFDEKGNLVFQWLCYDHFDVTGAVNENLGAKSPRSTGRRATSSGGSAENTTNSPSRTTRTGCRTSTAPGSWRDTPTTWP